MKAKAMVVVEPGRMEMKEFDVVAPASDQILIKLRMTSVCASDPKIFLGKTPFKGFPLIMGHELVGEVSEIGDEARAIYKLDPGARITVEPSVPCGHCLWCRTRYQYNKCRSAKGIGGNLTADKPPFLLGDTENICICRLVQSCTVWPIPSLTAPPASAPSSATGSDG